MFPKHSKFRVLSLIFVAISLVLFAAPMSFAAEKGTFIVGMERIPGVLYPSATSDLPDIAMNFFLYDALVTTVNGEIKPLLAESWEVSEDGLEYTFHLRKDVTFHSGRKFTAKDVKAHFDNWKNHPTSAKIAALESTSIVDDYTVKFNMKFATLVFLNMISQTEWSYGGIPDSVAVQEQGQDYGRIPETISGTGPFKMISWTRGDRIVLERNPDYKWGPEPYKNKGPAKVEKLIIRSIPEGASRTAELRTGGIDLDINLQQQDVKTIEDLKGFTVFSAPKITAHHMGFNMAKDLFQDVKLRKAMAHAVNQEAIIKTIYNNYADMAYGLWSPAVDGHTPEDEMKKYFHTFDLEKAKKLLDEAGWKKGSDWVLEKDGQPLRVTIIVYNENAERMMQIVQADMRKVGIDFQIRRFEHAAWRRAIENDEHEMYYVDGTHSTADLSYWFISKSIPYPNNVHLVDMVIDSLYDLSQRTLYPEVRTFAFQKIDQRLVDGAIIIPMPRNRWLIGMNESVKGLVFDPIHGMHKLIDVHKE